jgi:hypothetical protein
MKPPEKVLRSRIRGLPADARNVNIFNADGVLTRDRRKDRGNLHLHSSIAEMMQINRF